MKTIVFFLAGMITLAVASGQSQAQIENESIPPKFKSEKNDSFADFLQKWVKYPEVSSQWKHQGTVVVGFVVAASGELKDFRVINSVSPEADREVIRALKLTNERWIPGMVDGNPVEMQQEASVIFSLYPENSFVDYAIGYMQKGNHKLFVENRPKRALDFYDLGVKFLPNDYTLLATRCLCKQKMGDVAGAKRDLERISVLAERNGTNFDLEIFAELLKNSENVNEFAEFRNAIEE